MLERHLHKICLRLHWRYSTILKTSNKSVLSNVFWYIKVCIFWNCIQDSINWDKTQILKKFFSDKRNGTKNVLSFLSGTPTHHSFTFICDYYMSRSIRFVSVKLCVGFSIFDSIPLLLNLHFCSTKRMDSLRLKRHNSFQN